MSGGNSFAGTRPVPGYGSIGAGRAGVGISLEIVAAEIAAYRIVLKRANLRARILADGQIGTRRRRFAVGRFRYTSGGQNIAYNDDNQHPI